MMFGLGSGAFSSTPPVVGSTSLSAIVASAAVDTYVAVLLKAFDATIPSRYRTDPSASDRYTAITTGAVLVARVVDSVGIVSLDGEPDESLLLVRHLLLAAGITLVACLPLFAYWRFATGHWITNPRGPGTFFFSEPRIWSVLWSYRKGWFVYTPIMLAAIPGFFLLPRYLPRAALPIGLCTAAIIYIDSAWWSWWFGGSFGMRAFIELSSILSLPLAALVAWGSAGARRRRSCRPRRGGAGGRPTGGSDRE